MQFKELGKTGVLLPEVGLGTWEYTGGTGPLLAGLEAGALLIDTAESYGTELLVGRLIRELSQKMRGKSLHSYKGIAAEFLWRRFSESSRWQPKQTWS